MGKALNVIFLSVLTGMNAYSSLSLLSTYENNKTAIFQAELARDSKQSYDSARTISNEKAPSRDYWLGYCNAATAGLMAGIVLYAVSQKNKE